MSQQIHQTQLGHGKLSTYLFGYMWSIYLTLGAYFLVASNRFASAIVIPALIVLAVIQFIVQLVFFLHLGQETKPRWRLYTLLFMIAVVSIVVFGSLWIMSNLNYRMTPQQINNYMQSQDGL
jgi:cytochrome o ubiquinol oxidase operon protein cyoD